MGSREPPRRSVDDHAGDPHAGDEPADDREAPSGPVQLFQRRSAARAALVTTAPSPRSHRGLLYGLGLLLVAISLWCLLLLFRSHALRQDLELHQGWIDDMRRVRAELERPVAELGSQVRWPLLESLRRESEQLLHGHQDADLRQAAGRLASNLELLHGALLNEASADPAVASERIWDASFGVLKAASALEEQIQYQVNAIYARLDQHWRSLNVLVVVCLVLCASNLGLLHLAHRRRQQLEVARDRALQLASHDALTGLWNREAILKMLRRELSRSGRLKATMGLILADVDRFREINGLIGQERGDVVLQEIGWRLGSLVRPYDTVGRFAGDAFLIVLPTCDEVATYNVARRLSEAMHQTEIEYGIGRIAVSLSYALATVDRPEDADPDFLVHRLQEAMIELRRTTPTGGIADLRLLSTAASAVVLDAPPPRPGASPGAAKPTLGPRGLVP